jgi:hypothetical protein
MDLRGSTEGPADEAAEQWREKAMNLRRVPKVAYASIQGRSVAGMSMIRITNI